MMAGQAEAQEFGLTTKYDVFAVNATATIICAIKQFRFATNSYAWIFNGVRYILSSSNNL